MITDPFPLVRGAAARSLAEIDPPTAADLAVPLLEDQVRAVRMEAAESLAGTPNKAIAAGASASLASAIDDYIAAQELDADRPEAHVNLALLFAKQQQPSRAQAQLKIPCR